MDTEPITISSDHIQDHVGYWVMIKKIKSELAGDIINFNSDEQLLDEFGVSDQYLRRAKVKFRKEYRARYGNPTFEI